MDKFERERRSVLFGLSGLGILSVLGQGIGKPQTSARRGNVLGPSEGEHLVHFRDHGSIFIKAGSATGSEKLAFGTQQVTRGAGIPVHRHFDTEEAFYVLEGSGTVTLDDNPHHFDRGGTIFIPRNTWHGFANADHELLLIWIVSPAGLDGFFRETCSLPGEPPKHLTREQIREIALKYRTEFR
jgi:quercetin dioxygenase-like cupin family protein